jgi:hypothetical protein
LAGYIQCQLKEKCKVSVAYMIINDESTDIPDMVQVAVFIQGINEAFQTVEELLELDPTKRKTSANEVFSKLVTFPINMNCPEKKQLGL